MTETTKDVSQMPVSCFCNKFFNKSHKHRGSAGNYNQESEKKKKHLAVGGTVSPWCVKEVSHNRLSFFDTEMMELSASFRPPCPFS